MEALTPVDVQQALDAHQLGIQIQTFTKSTATSSEAATAIGTPLGSIVKSLVFMVEQQPIIVLAAGDQKIETRKLAALYDVGRKKVKIASPEQCIEYVGYAPGGVPPLGHRQKLPIYIDATLQRFAMVYAAAGTPNTIFPIPLQTLVAVSGGLLTDVIVDDEARPD